MNSFLQAAEKAGILPVEDRCDMVKVQLPALGVSEEGGPVI